ncbi:cleft lip and palate transmembrane 1 [Microthyrium microscopicum]|uniref:Cleft lip and palate transmembrane 1 n=1 Tax=Microthyrium microscopicum TaxID=703497 RepID=A0A6A6U8J5_9PEZI|nr:cleft lip and palate transmembrane 1 [Microthyrium microscopicum]
MPERQRAAAPAQGARAPEEQGNSSMLKSIAQSIAIFFLIQFAMKQFTGGGQTAVSSGTAPSAIPSFNDRPQSFAPEIEYADIPQNIAPIWTADQALDVSIYVSGSLIMPPLSKAPKDSLVVEEKAFGYGAWKEKREIDTSFPVPKEIRNNGTIWAHVYVGQAGAVLDPSDSKYDPAKAYYFVRHFTQYLPKKKVRKTRNLLEAKNDTEPAEAEIAPKATQFASYYHPNFTLSFIPDAANHDYPSMHPAVRSFVQLERSGARDESGKNGWYYPILYVNTFWQLKNHMTELNETVTTLPLHITLNNMANWKFSIMASIDEGMKINAAKAAQGESMGPGQDGAEFEDFKRILLDSNIYLLSITGVVSIFHMIFEGLAFKSDVSHWRNKKDNVGTSFRSILANVVMQAIIFLYLMDNNENTSWMILFGQGMGIAIEAWKITKTVNVRIRPSAPGSLIPYAIHFEDKHQLSDTEKKTQEYDQIAFKYLYIVAVPLLLAYAVYSVIYDSHKSWYSFIITTLVGSVYAYGFLMMVPSLYINYRLKSVAHMPGRAMMYKFLNTFIDDLFAFTIKMPMLHRLATLRDDVIFFVYLYQMWAYKVDHTRVNEFGQGGDDEEQDEGKSASKPLAAAPSAGAEGEVKALPVDDIKKAEKETEAKATGVAQGSKGRKRK